MRTWIVVGTIVSLLLVSLAIPATQPADGKTEKWALIAAPVHEGGHTLQDALEMRDYLLAHGWNDDQIIFLTDGSTDWFVDGDATKAEIESAILWIADNSDPDDLVAIILGDRGIDGPGYSSFQTSDDKDVYDYELADWVSTITCDRMIIELSFDYSGGFIEELSAPNRLIVTSHASGEATDYNYYNLVDGLTAQSADSDGNGLISVEEAQQWIISELSGIQNPQIDDQIPGETYL